MKKILVSFRENEEEIKLYLEVKSQPKKKQSKFVKDALREFIDKNSENGSKKVRNNKKTKNKK